jgi:hypothetical protein
MNTNQLMTSFGLVAVALLSFASCTDTAPPPTDEMAPQRAALDECLDQTDCWNSWGADDLIGSGNDGTGCSDATDSLPRCENDTIRMGTANLTTACTGPQVPCPNGTVCIGEADLPLTTDADGYGPQECNSGDPVSCIEHFCVDPQLAANCHASEVGLDPGALTLASLARLDGTGPAQPDECATPTSDPKRRGVAWCKAYHRCQSRRLVDPVEPGWLRTVSGSVGDALVQDWLFFSDPAGCIVEVVVDASQSAAPTPIDSFVCAGTPCQGLLHVGCLPE